MQKIIQALQALGERIQKNNPLHEKKLKEQLQRRAQEHGSVPQVAITRIPWFSYLSFAAVSAFVLVLGVRGGVPFLQDAPSAFVQSSSVQEDDFIQDTARPKQLPYPDDEEDYFYLFTTPELLVYEDEHGSMLTESVDISLLTQQKNADETILELFTKFNGYIASFTESNQQTFSLQGSIPTEHFGAFFTEIEKLVKDDAFLEKSTSADNIADAFLSYEKQEKTLLEAQERLKKEYASARTAAEREIVQQSLNTAEKSLANIAEQRKQLTDKAAYVSVTLSAETIPYWWEAQNMSELTRIVSGYETPSMLTRSMLNVAKVFLIAASVVSEVFWLLIPLGAFFVVRAYRKKSLRILE